MTDIPPTRAEIIHDAQSRVGISYGFSGQIPNKTLEILAQMLEATQGPYGAWGATFQELARQDDAIRSARRAAALIDQYGYDPLSGEEFTGIVQYRYSPEFIYGTLFAPADELLDAELQISSGDSYIYYDPYTQTVVGRGGLGEGGLYSDIDPTKDTPDVFVFKGPNGQLLKRDSNGVLTVINEDASSPGNPEGEYSVIRTSTGQLLYIKNGEIHNLDLNNLGSWEGVVPPEDQYCFGAGTPILMADGSSKTIEAIRPGDLVLAFDAVGKIQPKPVTRTYINEGKKLVNREGLLVTPNHLFLTPGGKFRSLGQMAPSDLLVDRDGAAKPVNSCDPVEGLHRVFNFSVADYHTYIAGGYRVHNDSPMDLGSDQIDFKIRNSDGSLAAIGFDEFGSKLAVVSQAFDANGNVTRVSRITATRSASVIRTGDVLPNGNFIDPNDVQVEVDFGEQVFSGEGIGSAFGSFLGNYIGGDNIFLNVFATAAFSTVLGNVGKAAQIYLRGVDISPQADGQSDSFSEALDNTFSNFGNQFASAAVSAGISQISSFIVGELIGGDDMAAALGRTVANSFVSAALSEVASEFVPSLAGQGFANFNPFVAVFSFFGSQLSNGLIAPETQDAALISNVLATVGSLIGSIWGPIGSLIGQFLGQTIGSLLGNLFGGDPERPTARADIYVDETGHVVAPGTGGAFNDGSVADMVPMAEALATTINALLDGLGGDARIDLPNGTAYMSMGFRVEDGYIVGRNYGGHNLWDLAYTNNWETAFERARNLPLDDGLIVGGDAWGRRIFYYSDWENFDELLQNLQVAVDYRKYLENKEVIDILIAETPDSAFAAGWAITLAQAAAMGLTNPYALHNRIEGTAGADTLTADDRFNNELIGLAGNDTLLGGDGHDLLEGGAGADVLDGGAGEDTASYKNSTAGVAVNLATGAATGGDAAGDTFVSIERLIGSVHADTFTGDGNDNVIAGMAGNDTLSGGAGDDLVEGGAGADVMDGGEGYDIANYGGSAAGVRVSLQEGATLGQGFGGDAEGDTLTGFEAISGSIFADLLTGNSQDNALMGNAGNDILVGLGGADTLIGGDGSDFADYSASNEAVNVNLATGIATGGHAEGDRYSSVENLIGTAFNDTLIGDNFGNIIEGGAGADILDGGAGVNVLSYASSTAGVNVNLITNTVSGGDAEGDTISNFTHVIGTHFNDHITVADPDAIVLAGGGDDVIVPFSGNARIDGGDGYDTVSFFNVDKATYFTGFQRGEIEFFQGSDIYAVWDATKAGQAVVHSDFLGDRYLVELNSIEWLRATEFDDIIDFNDIGQYVLAGGGNDVMRGREGEDAFLGGEGNDHLVGGLGDDLLLGEEGDDILDGDGDRYVFQPSPSWLFNEQGELQEIPWGEDTLDGGAGNDLLRGNGGNDTYVFGRGYGHDMIEDRDYELIQTGVVSGYKLPTPIYSEYTIDAGIDTLEFGPDVLPEDVVAAQQGNDLVLFLKDSDDRITIKNWNDPNQRVEIFRFSENGQTINVAGWSFEQFAAIFNPAPLPVDTVDHSSSPDAVTVTLQPGETAGIYNVVGSRFDDVITGNAGDNIIEGGEGADTLDGAAGFDFISFESAFSRVDVSLTGALPANYELSLYNFQPVDPASAALGDTYANFEGLIGSSFDDALLGNGNDNVLIGGKGADRLYGSLGNDIYRFSLGDGHDIVRDVVMVYNAKSGPTYGVGGVDDLIEFGEGLHLADIVLRKGVATAGEVATSLIVSVSDTNQIEIQDWFASSYAGRIENLRFANGLEIDLEAIGTVRKINPNGTSNQTIGAGNGIWTVGSAGNDTIAGGAGNDVLVGGAGNDTLQGQGGADVLAGGAGNDTLLGAGGTDRAVYAGKLEDFDVYLSSNPALGSHWVVQDLNTADGNEGTDQLQSIEEIYFDDVVFKTSGNNAPYAARHLDFQTAEEEEAFSFTIPAGTFRDPDAGAVLTYSAVLSDGGALPSWLAFNGATGTFSGTPPNAGEDFYSIRVTATDQAGAGVSLDFLLHVVETNEAPVAAMSLADQTVQEDAAFSFILPAGAFTDADAGDVLAYTAVLSDGSALPSWLSFDAPARRLVGTPSNADVGEYDIRIVARDGADASASIDFTLTVANVNDAPHVSLQPAAQRAMEAELFTFALPGGTFVDVDAGDVLVYSAALDNGDPLPAWLAFDPATQTLSGTPAFADTGSYVVRITATDGAGAAAFADFTVTADDQNDAPVVVTPLEDRSVAQEAWFQFVLPADAFADIDAGDTLAFSADMADGAALPDWLLFDAETRTFQGFALDEHVGIHEVRVTVTDAEGASVASVFELTVDNVNDAPYVSLVPLAQLAGEGEAFSYVLPAGTFADVDEGDVLTWSAVLANGDPLPAWLSFDPATRTFSGTPANGDVGTLTVGIVVTDLEGATAHTGFTLEVRRANVAPAAVGAVPGQAATEDAAFLYTLPAGLFTDADLDEVLTYSALLADGSALPSWLAFDAETLSFSGTPENGDVGELDIRIVATDTFGETASTDFTLTVANVNDAPTVAAAPADRSATEDVAFSFTLPVDAFADIDAGDTLAYAATLPDGSALPAWLSFDPVTRSFSGTPGNADIGTVTVRIVATDGAGATASADFDIDVANVNDAPTILAGVANQTADEDAAFSFTVPAGTFGDVDAGDTLTFAATLASGSPLPAWLAFDAQTRTFSGTPANGHVGTLTLRVVATDAAGASVSTDFSLTVANVNDAPVASVALADQNATSSQAFSYTVPAGAFTDVDAGDTLTYAATLADGSALPAWLSFNAATRTFSGTPPASSAPAYAVKVTATDAAGASAFSSFNLAVATNAGNEIYDGVLLTGVIDGGPGSDTVTYGAAAAAVTVDLINGGSAGAAAGDTYLGIETIVGSAYNDTLLGDNNNNIIAGGAGADTIDGRGGFDWAWYGEAAAGITANMTAGTVTSGTHVDTLTNIEGVFGSAFNDTFVGSSGADVFRGHGGFDQASGAAGNDTYVVGLGGRTMITDVMIASSTPIPNAKIGSNITLGDAGQDTILFGEGIGLADIIVAQTQSLYMTSGLDLNVTVLDDTVATSSADMSSGTGATIVGWFNYVAIIDSVVNPTSGLTRIETFKFADGLEISTGNISVVASDLNDVASTWTGTAANEWYSGRGGNDTITGAQGDDVLIGGSGDDTLNGGAGNDVLSGGSGNDILKGQAGYDIYSFGRGDGQDRVNQVSADASGGLAVFGEGIAVDQLWFGQDGTDLIVSVVGTTDSFTVGGFFNTATTREITEFRAGGLSLDTSIGSTAVSQLVSAMAAFSPPPVGQLELTNEIRNDVNVSTALAAWAA